MDWVEEKWEQAKKYIQNESIKKSLFWYCLAMLLVVAVLTIFTKWILGDWLVVLLAGNVDIGEGAVQSINEFSFADLYWVIASGTDEYTSFEKIFYSIYMLFPYAYLIIGVIILAQAFYENKLKPAISSINNCTTAITEQNYDVEATYIAKDELGQCCENIEKLRRYLVSEKIIDWETQAQQREINATFAHDMRTPLTVIEGYTEFLQRHIPNGKISNAMILEKLELMKYQEERLYEFSKTMTQIRKIEELEIHKKPVKIGKFINTILSVTQGVEQSSDRKISLTTDEIENSDAIINIDESVVLEILENLLSNAIRYSKECIEIIIVNTSNTFQISVCDDGDGFSDEALKKATNTYYTEENNSKEHFGIGLSTSATLAKKHGGSLKFTNQIGGGAVVVLDLPL